MKPPSLDLPPGSARRLRRAPTLTPPHIHEQRQPTQQTRGHPPGFFTRKLSACRTVSWLRFTGALLLGCPHSGIKCQIVQAPYPGRVLVNQWISWGQRQLHWGNCQELLTNRTGCPTLPTVSDQYLSPKSAAAVVGCHEDTLKKWASDGIVPATKTPGGWWRFKRIDLEPFIGLLGTPTEEQAS